MTSCSEQAQDGAKHVLKPFNLNIFLLNPVSQTVLNYLSNTCHTHCQHVITLHIWQFSIFTLVVELPEKVEGHYCVEVHHHC